MKVHQSRFVTALLLENHPMQSAKSRLKMHYFIGLEYLIERYVDNNEYTSARLAQYRSLFVKKAILPKMSYNKRKNITELFINSKIRPWRKKYSYWLLCDIALILMDENKIQKTEKYFKGFLTKRQALQLDILLIKLFNDEEIPKEISFTTCLVNQYRANRNFAIKPMTRIVVTANVSAGKSTLINAIIGKPLTKTAQEICTSNLCYLYNKPFEDNLVHLSASPLNLNASYNDLANADPSVVRSIASHFRMTVPANRICIIDTPGVNSAINKHHREITYKVLKGKIYDKLIYVLNANKIGTDEEKRHLQWVAENVPYVKVVFVLNKLDGFQSKDDSIERSIKGIKRDLLAIGFKDPIICPLSSYFAYLIKLKVNKDKMTLDEMDAYEYYVKKFSKEEHDLSNYLSTAYNNESDSELIQMSKKSGLYGLEQVLFGGDSQ